MGQQQRDELLARVNRASVRFNVGGLDMQEAVQVLVGSGLLLDETNLVIAGGDRIRNDFPFDVALALQPAIESAVRVWVETQGESKVRV
jgi:hypothetical protein